MMKVTTEKETQNDIPMTFSGYFSHFQDVCSIRERAAVGVFPVLYEKANTISMQKHAMTVIKKATEFVNPGQTPVIVGDCPLYALQKKCQWKFPNEVGESQMVCFLSFLHIEMPADKCAGNLLVGSGWDRMFTLSDIHTSGVALSLLGAKDVKRTRHAHHLTLALITKLKHDAYGTYCVGASRPHVSFDMWLQRQSAKSPTFWFWLMAEELLLVLCRFIRGQRTGDWTLTKQALHDLCPWFFTFGHTNYARWLPVFLRDMALLPSKHLSVHEEFERGKFVVQRSDKKFSLMALDQSQEHCIKFLKE